jgi:hypothetical protein
LKFKCSGWSPWICVCDEKEIKNMSTPLEWYM